MLSNITNGQKTGTGANIDIELGYLPSKVEVTNVTTGIKLEYFSSMAAGSAFAQGGAAVAAVASPAGITPLNSTFQGFRIGTHAVNTAGQILHWVAYRNGPGSGK